MESLVRTNYPKDKFIVVLSAEERAGEHGREVCEEVYKEYRNKFFHLLTTSHPEGIEGELAGKGANSSWAGKRAKELIDSLGIKYENILASIFDIDTVSHPDYFARLTYVFLTSKNPLRASYQPIPFYTNNIWEAGPLSRVVAFSASFWHMLQQERPERITTFSSHSMPFFGWMDVDFGQRLRLFIPGPRVHRHRPVRRRLLDSGVQNRVNRNRSRTTASPPKRLKRAAVGDSFARHDHAASGCARASSNSSVTT